MFSFGRFGWALQGHGERRRRRKQHSSGSLLTPRRMETSGSAKVTQKHRGQTDVEGRRLQASPSASPRGRSSGGRGALRVKLASGLVCGGEGTLRVLIGGIKGQAAEDATGSHRLLKSCERKRKESARESADELESTLLQHRPGAAGGSLGYTLGARGDDLDT